MFWGFGPVSLNAVSFTYSQQNGATIRRHHFGYLTLEEIGYIVARRDYFFSTSSSQHCSNSIAKQALSLGKGKYRQELKRYPLGEGSLVFRIASRIRTRLKSQGLPSTVRLQCLSCSQELALPRRSGKMNAKCPNCQTQFLCQQ